MPSFVVGPENVLAASVTVALLDTCDPTRSIDAATLHVPSVVAIHGTCGVGKSHLLHGLVEHWQSVRGADAACYLSAGDFRRELMGSLHDDTIADFRRRFRSCQLLAIDELDNFSRDGYLLEELRYTLDDRSLTGLVTLVASQRAAACLSNLSTDVRSRLASGLVLQLVAPGAAARAKIVAHAAEALGRPLSSDASCRLAADPANANDVFRSLFELLATGEPTQALDGETVRLHIARRADRRPSIREIIAVVARYFRLPQKTLKSGSRKQAVVLARATIVYLARELADVSYEQIGQALGGRDHSTIMHNFRTIDRNRKHDWQLQETLDDLRRVLLSR
jgi:chromosomal replication initiator protein